MKQQMTSIVTALSVFFSVFCGGNAFASSPRISGRWGESQVPAQLLYKSESFRTTSLVVISMSSICPLTKRLIPILNELQQQHHKSGVQFIGLFPNGLDNAASISDFALDTDLMFPIYNDDPNQPWHEQLGMSITPEVVMLDVRNGYDPTKVVYRGKVNDMWFGGGTANGSKPYLKMAIESFLAGRTPELKETAPSGCAIAKKRIRDLSAYKDITYYKHVAPIIQSKCQDCHRVGEPGAELFAAFDSYEIVATLSDVIFDRVENRIMPPWQGRMGNPEKHGGFTNDARLSDEEMNILLAWREQGLNAGDPNEAPAPRAWPNPNEWRIGTPDFIFKMNEPYVVPRKRLDEYQYYRVEGNFSEDRYVQAIETRPGNKAVVHHIGAIIGPATNAPLTGTQAMLQFYGLTGDKIRKVGDYIPGDSFNAHRYPDGYGLKIPAGYDLVFEMHYTPTGRAEESDQSEMGIIWAKEKPQHVIETKVFNRKDIRLQPHDMHYRMTSNYMFESDVIIYALAPHMHYRGKSFRLTKIVNPGTTEEMRETILKVPTYDFNWQRTYELERPLKVKAGDILHGEVVFDNSHLNPNNPNPEDKIEYGIKSAQEMFNFRVKFERTVL